MSKLLNFSSRFMMIFMVLIFWIASAVLMLLGIKMFMFIGSVHGAIESKYVSVPAVVLVCLSLMCLCIGIIGCAGASFKAPRTQQVFFALLFLIFLMEITGFILCVVYKDTVQQSIDHTFTIHLNGYGTNAAYTNSLDSVQKTFYCCGANTSADWSETPWGKDNLNSVPLSCCNISKCEDNPIPMKSQNYYRMGCESKLYGAVKAWLVWLIVLGVIFVLIQIIVLTCTCIRMKNSKKVKYQTLEEDEKAAHGYRA